MSFRTLQAIMTKQKNGTLFAVIAIILIIVIAAAYNAFRFSSGAEGFADTAPAPAQQVSASPTCPPGSIAYVSPKGSTLCCKGDIIDRKCSIKPLCRLSSESEFGVPHCSDIVSSEFDKLAAKYCTKELPYVYELKSGERGCTNRVSLPGVDSLPTGTPKCTINPDYETDRRMVASCLNKKMLEEYECIGENCTKTWWPAAVSGSRQYTAMPAIALTYSVDSAGPQGMNKMCIAKQTGLEMMDSHPGFKNTYRTWKVKNHAGQEVSWYENLDKSPMICESAKKIYIEKSIPTEEVVD